MKSRALYCAAFLATVCFANVAQSYELLTHGLITKQAYQFSRLSSSGKFAQIGLVDLAVPFSNSYYDFNAQSNTVYRRFATTYEGGRMSSSGVGITRPLSVLGWIAGGAIREDDGGFLAGTKVGEPLDDSFGNFNRFCNHFLDPITRNALSLTFLQDPINLCPTSSTQSAANWALGVLPGSSDAFSDMPVDANTRNHFSVFAAHEAMWRALTLRQKDGTPAPRPDILYAIPTWTKEDDRKAYWATTFRAIGDILHLNQDVAQPQHTRNEGHGSDHATLYERYVDARVSQPKKFTFNGEGTILAELGTLPPLPVNLPYPVPRFNRYSDYWSTQQGSASILSGNGLADYSSRGFFTPAKNLGTSYGGFPSPTNNESLYTTIVDPSQPAGDCRIYEGKQQYARSKLPDDFVVPGDPMAKTRYASRSLVDGQWTLNRCVFDDRVDLLIPRAVAYSAGLIDYFFRGQLEIRPPEEGVYAVLDHSKAADNCKDNCGFKKIKLKVANSTPDIAVSGTTTIVPQPMSGGTLVAVAKYHKNTCYTTDLEGEYDSRSGKTLSEYLQLCRSLEEEITVSQPLTNQSPVACNANVAGDCDTKLQGISNTLTFNFSTPIPINATDLYLQVVYRGPLGSEQDAVVVATKDIAEPTYFSIVNVSDYLICYNNSWLFKDSNGNLPGSIPTMVDGKLATDLYKARSYEYWNVTFQPVQNTTLAQAVAIQPKEFARFAILVEPGQQFNDKIAGYVDPVPPPYKLVTAGLNQSGYTATGSPTIALFDYKTGGFRKVKSHVPIFGYNHNTQGAGGICVDVPVPPEPTDSSYTKPTVMKEVTFTF